MSISAADVLRAAAENLIAEHKELWDLNYNQAKIILELQGRLNTATRVFGEAFVSGSGPSRPNRPKLTEIEVKDIRDAYRGGMKQRDLAKNYGVNPATISRLVRGIYH